MIALPGSRRNRNGGLGRYCGVQRRLASIRDLCNVSVAAAAPRGACPWARLLTVAAELQPMRIADYTAQNEISWYPPDDAG
jgi:hypothetical protein